MKIEDAEKLAARAVEILGPRRARAEIFRVVLRRIDRLRAEAEIAASRGDLGTVLACGRRSDRAFVLGDAMMDVLE